MTKIWLVRHGESEGNLKNSLTGYPGDSLTSRGITQAKKLGKFLNSRIGLRPSKIITSSMLRAIQTAECLNIGEISYSTDLLNETDGGSASDWTKDEFRNKFPEFWLKFNPAAAFPGGESHIDLYNRVIAGMENILSEAKKGEDILIVCHAGTISSILHSIYQVDLKMFTRFSTDNCSLTLLEYDEHKVPCLRFFNKTAEEYSYESIV